MALLGNRDLPWLWTFLARKWAQTLIGKREENRTLGSQCADERILEKKILCELGIVWL